MAVIVYVPDTVAPSAGAVSVTAGGVVSVLLTVTLFESLAVLPAASTALALAVCAPLGEVVVSHTHE